MMSDSIADMLTRIRNAQEAGKDKVSIPFSNMKESISEILKKEGYIKDFETIQEGPQGEIEIELKYQEDSPAIRSLQRISVPGQRIYRQKDNLPRIKNGYGIAVISTSDGLMTDREAREKGVGGEVICSVY